MPPTICWPARRRGCRAGGHAESGPEPVAELSDRQPVRGALEQCPEHSRLAYQAYSAYVLARVGKAPLATLRLIWEQQADHARSGLPLLHLSLALSAMGMSRTPPRPLPGRRRPSAVRIIWGLRLPCVTRPSSYPCFVNTSWPRSAGQR